MGGMDRMLPSFLNSLVEQHLREEDSHNRQQGSKGHLEEIHLVDLAITSQHLTQ